MEKFQGILPERANYKDALRLAWNKIEKRFLSHLAQCAGAEFLKNENSILLPFLEEKFTVSVEKRTITSDLGCEVYPFLCVLLLHYLIGAKDIPLTSEFVSFRQFEGGDTYFPAFERESIKKIREKFQGREEELTKVARRLPHEIISLGDVSVKIFTFPKLPISFVLNKACEEFPAHVNILFDKSARRFLSTEDIAVATALTSNKLCKKLEKELDDNRYTRTS